MEHVIRSPAGEPVARLLNPVTMARSLWRHRELTLQLAQREIIARYKHSWLGLLWTVITPLILLAIYTFVFAVVLKARWGAVGTEESRGVFALTMFCGILVYNLFTEVINQAPTVIVDNANYVKRVVFPLEVFVVAGLLVALFNLLVGSAVWLVGWGLIMQSWPNWTAIWFLPVLVPVALTTAGLAWVLASVGVFVRDVGHAVVLVTQLLFFATPIFYPISRVPEKFQLVMKLNPLTHAVEDARRVLMYGGHPDWPSWAVLVVVSGVVALLGYAFFMKSKRAFADVL
jgi:lipopolysaccharide transport system permease protein